MPSGRSAARNAWVARATTSAWVVASGDGAGTGGPATVSQNPAFAVR